MAYTVTADGRAVINLAPESVTEEVIQNLTMILLTLKNTVPLDRGFGLSARFLDKPTPAAEAILVAEIFDAVEEYEPRAEIVNISFERDEGIQGGGNSGKVFPRLEVVIHDE